MEGEGEEKGHVQATPSRGFPQGMAPGSRHKQLNKAPIRSRHTITPEGQHADRKKRHRQEERNRVRDDQVDGTGERVDVAEFRRRSFSVDSPKGHRVHDGKGYVCECFVDEICRHLNVRVERYIRTLAVSVELCHVDDG